MSAPPHVVMLVANDVSVDSRVRKSALAVAALGARVTVVGITTQGLGRRSMLGDVLMIRVPVQLPLSQARRERRARWHAGKVPLLSASPEREQLARRRLAVAERDVVLHSRTARVRHEATAARRWWLRARGAGRRLLARGVTLGFKAGDRVVQRSGVGVRPTSVLPEVDDYELAVGPVLDELAPDVVHAHDMHFMAVAARACARAAERGRTVPWVYDAHEWVPGLSRYGGRTARVVAAWSRFEREYIRGADRVLTVSPDLAEALQRRHHLPRLPDVVLNIPPVEPAGTGGHVATVRETIGLAPDVPLLVYSGGVQAGRGLTTAVEALVHLPQAHLAVVAVPNTTTPGAEAVRARARALDVADRLHVLPPVSPELVSAFLSGCDVGLIPLMHYGSHEMALANKLFEYLHAGVPMVVSDCRAQAAFVTEHGLGAVHRAGDAQDLATAVRGVLADRGRFAARLADPDLRARYTWQAQAAVLQGVYRDLLPAAELSGRDLPEVGPGPTGAQEVEVAAGTVVLGIGPANSAGQADAWARAAERNLPGVHGYVVAVSNGVYDYPADEVVPAGTYREDVAWQLAELARARTTWTHALIEAGRPVFGGLLGRDFRGDAAELTAAGVRVGLVFHGSEVRSPRRHRAAHPNSPFADAADPYTRKLQARTDALLDAVAGSGLPAFVSTPDQLDDVPDATWLPVVVDPARWPRRADVLTRTVPVVVHAPSNPRLKGTEHVERVLRPYAERGLLELRMVSGLPPAEAAAVVRGADVVIDQLLLGLYGVLACEAMACGALVLGYLGASLRGRVGEPIPVVETAPGTLGAMIEQILDDRAGARERAAAGPSFVSRVHDGRRSAAVLAPFLGLGGPAGDEPRAVCDVVDGRT